MTYFKMISNILGKLQKVPRSITMVSYAGKIQSYIHKQTVLCSTANSNDSKRMIELLKQKFPQANTVEVIDVSGGCGAMYEIIVESTEFKGLPIVKQHRLINDALKEQIKDMHGLRIQTSVPAENG